MIFVLFFRKMMKQTLFFNPIKLMLYAILPILLTSCTSLRVSSDYDSQIDFNRYRTYGFFKPGIDKVEISDLDKRRILSGLEEALNRQGYTASESPDILVSFQTKATERVSVHQHAYYGWGWHPWSFYGAGHPYSSVNTTTQGILYIDIIDTKKNQLIWQGKGIGVLSEGNVQEREARIKEFVSKILAQFPPWQE